MRRSEISYDVDGHRIFDVADTKTAEGERDVYLPDDARKTIAEILIQAPAGEWLFSYEDGHRIRSKAFNRALHVACRSVGIPERSTHKIRKTYASTLIDGDVSEKIIQRQLGHKDFSTTKKYYDRDRTSAAHKQNVINQALKM